MLFRKKVFKPETTYIEDLYRAKQKQKLSEQKKKRKPTIGFAPVNKKMKTENSSDKKNEIQSEIKSEIKEVKTEIIEVKIKSEDS